MIQANELRIGNLVFSLETQESQRIEGVDSEYIYLDCITFDYTKVNDICPLNITEELKKSINFLNEFILIDKTGFIIFKNGYAYQFIFDDYPYIHQLQNLYFSLTGKELEINL